MNNDNLKLVFIMRGLPGSGKSTLARQLVGGAVRGNMHSTDTYFIDADGAYRFNPAKLAEFHAKNFQAFYTLITKITLLFVMLRPLSFWGVRICPFKSDG